MKKQFIGILVLLALFASCGQNPFTPDAELVARLVLDGEMQRVMTWYGRPLFTGYVKNIGDVAAWNVMIAITCYSDAEKITIIDVANGFPASGGDIPRNQRAYFEAIVFGCDSWDEIKGFTVKITWLNR